MASRNWSYYVISNFLSSAACLFLLQCKQQYPETGPDAPSLVVNIFVYHSFLLKLI